MILEQTYTKEQLNLIWDILVDAGAREDYRSDFIQAHSEGGDCKEYRFQGKFGFGGKFRSGKISIDYYRENETDELDKLKDEINDKLINLFYGENVGKKVAFNSNMRWADPTFASGNEENTVSGLIRHPSFGTPAYTFEEDDSVIQCYVCEVR